MPKNGRAAPKVTRQQVEPIKCTPYKDNLDHTPRRAEANKKVGNAPALYNPDITERGSPEKAIRIFINKPEKGKENTGQFIESTRIPKMCGTYTQMALALMGIPQEQEPGQESSVWKMRQRAAP